MPKWNYDVILLQNSRDNNRLLQVTAAAVMTTGEAAGTATTGTTTVEEAAAVVVADTGKISTNNNNKKVLLRERKRHIARRVASTRCVALSPRGGVYPHPAPCKCVLSLTLKKYLEENHTEKQFRLGYLGLRSTFKIDKLHVMYFGICSLCSSHLM